MTAYVGLFFFIPFLNVLGNRLTKSQFQYLLVTVFVLFSVVPTLLHRDVFPVEGGYSIWWLGVLVACISWLAAASFSVYVLHCNVLIGKWFLWDVFEWAASSSPALMVVKVLAMAVAVYAGCSLVDAVRRYLFKTMDVNREARAVVGFSGSWAVPSGRCAADCFCIPEGRGNVLFRYSAQLVFENGMVFPLIAVPCLKGP